MISAPFRRFRSAIRRAVLIGALSATPAHADFFSAKVVEVVDGDTIKVIHLGKQMTVRLQGIDSPELKQPYGSKAREFTAGIAEGQNVVVAVVAEEPNILVGEVIFKDGRSLSREVIRAGFAWWDRKYVDDPSYSILMAKARQEKRGLWADSSPVAPCIFRLIH